MTRHKTALIIIDMQNAYFNNGALAERKEKLTAACNELIGHFVSKNMPVITVRTEHQRDKSTWTLNMLEDGQGYLFENDDDAACVTGLQTSGTGRLVKTRDSAFYGTDLVERLHTLEVRQLVLAGVSTHSCVLYTAADAYAANIPVVLATDAIASHDPSRHDSTLDMLEQEYRQRLLTNAKIIEQFS